MLPTYLLLAPKQKDPPRPKGEPAFITPALNASSYYVSPFRGLPTLVRFWDVNCWLSCT